MERFVRMLLSLGAGGALANAKAVLDARQREDWVIEGLLLRIDREEIRDVPAREVVTSAAAS